jgi:hypothetical protein
MSHPTNPFLIKQLPDGAWIGHTTAAQRCWAINRFTLLQCRLALALPNLQRQVLKALDRRVAELEQATG